MTTSILTTKLYIPPIRPELVSRPRLIERLNAGLHAACKLTLISAPAGFGKTTLLSEWVAGCDQPVAWLSLDEGDNDPTRFWTYVAAALQTVHPDVGQGVLAALESSQPPPIELLLTGLINEIATGSTPFVLVLDDLHQISSRQIQDGLAFLIDHLPEQVHVVFSTRADPPWPLARRRARGEIFELRADELRFTPQEAAAFLNSMVGPVLSAQDVAALDARTEGWIAGLQLAALSMRGRDAQHASAFVSAFSGSHRLILDYLVEEVLDRQIPAIQTFLFQTSILERMTAPLCAAVIGEDDSQDLLDQLDRANLFLVPLDDERRWYRYHHLFADLLRHRLHHTLPDQVLSLHRRASDWYEAEGLLDEAIAHALAAQELERAADLVERNGMHMIVRSQVTALARWLEELPAPLVHTRSWLCVFHAWARYYVGPRERVEPRLQDAERALQAASTLAESERQHVAGHVAALRAYMALQNEELERVAELAQQALDLLPREDYARATSAIALAEVPRERGDLVASERAYVRAREIAEECGNVPMAVSATAYMAYQQAKQGRLHKALATNREALSLAVGSDGRQLPAAGLPYVKMGDLMREWNDLETASRYLEKGTRLCLQWGHADALVTGYATLARVQLAQGDLSRARDSFRQAEQIARQTAVDPWAICWLDDCRLRLWLVAGDLAAAVSWTEASGLMSGDDFSFVRDLEHVNLARVLVARGTRQPDGPYLGEALGLLTRLAKAAEEAGWVGRTIEILALQSVAFGARGDERDAWATLARALALGEAEGYVRAFVDEGAPMRELLEKVVARRIAPGYAAKLLTAFGVEGKDTPEPRPSTALVEPLTGRELQVLRLLTTDLTSPEIAQELVVSVNTVRTHIRHIYDKLGVRSRYEAVARARDLGLL